MTEQAWLKATDARALLAFLRETGSHRKQRLFGVACCYRVRHLLDRGDPWRAIEVAEQRAEVPAPPDEMWIDQELADAMEPLEVVPFPGVPYPNAPAYYVTWQHAPDAADSVAYANEEEVRYVGGDVAAERAAQVDTLRDIFGPLPFRSVIVDGRWLTETVVTLASGIYTEKAFDRMPILGDALEEAGCNHADILTHCRSDEPHVRGCWVVDLILGKE